MKALVAMNGIDRLLQYEAQTQILHNINNIFLLNRNTSNHITKPQMKK